MRSKTLQLLFIGIAILLSINCSRAQDHPVFTQYMFNEVFINPAYAGSQDALSINGLCRKQWVGIEGAPSTQTFVVHSPLFNKNIGLGISVLNENIGPQKRTETYLNYSYRILLSKGTFRLGLLGGMQTSRELYSKVKTTQAQDAQFMYDSPRVISPNFGFGAYYNTSNLFAGISIPRMIHNKMDISTSKTTSRVDPKNFTYYTVLGYVFNVNSNFKLKPTIMVSMVEGAPVNVNFNLMTLLKNKVWLGASYRDHNAVSAIFGLQITSQFRASYSYDYSLSKLQQYNSGSHEIQLSYLFSFNKENIASPRLF